MATSRSIEADQWGAAQSANPLAVQPIATLAADLTTGAVNAPGTNSNPPVYTVEGVIGLYGPGGATANGSATPPAKAGGGTGGHP